MEIMENEKNIGLVKWFHDQAKDANYGFIQHAKLGDLFFHEHSIEQGQNINSFRENEIVIFISQESKRHKGKLEAIEVKILATEKDLIFLFNHFLSLVPEKSKYSDYNLIQKGVHTQIEILIKEITDNNLIENLFIIFNNYVNDHLKEITTYNEELLTELLKICKNFFPNNYNLIADSITAKIPIELAHKLWLKGSLLICQVDFVAGTILSASQNLKRSIFYRCSEDDKSNIFFKILYSIDKIDSLSKLYTLKDFLCLTKEYGASQFEKVMNAALNNCPDYFKLNLWLEDYHQNLDFNAYKHYTITLSPEDQKKFVKKVLKYIHEGKAVITLDDLTSINVIDYETSKLLEQIDESHLDYSTSIILNVISELNNQIKLESRKETGEAQNKIFDLILKQINDPKDILQITGYFDECEGRSTVSVITERNDQGEIISRNITYYLNQYQKPRFHPICDGRKAINKTTNKLILDEENNTEFWWCANQKCFKPNRVLHDSNQWEKYTLLDFLTILKIQYREVDLEIYLNIINKANRFLKHLKCRECDHILYPVGKSQYAFYGISNFYCKNDECSELGKEIYLSHCLNGLCEMEIDSRDCVKCKPEGHAQDICGWYVCNYCHSCCSTPQLEKRKWVYDNILHKDYTCHLIGHKELGIISCNKCGDSMVSYEMNLPEYQKILDWFIEYKDRSANIRKSGKNKYDKWWFLISRRDMSHDIFKKRLNKYFQLGFQIPDIDTDKEIQLISEPKDFTKHFIEILTCRSCGNTLDLSNDFERARAIRSFHSIRFIKEKPN